MTGSDGEGMGKCAGNSAGKCEGGAAEPNVEPAFAVDAMLGTLAKWLRLSGYDTVFDGKLDDDSLLAVAIAEGRLLLTRDRGLADRAGKIGIYVDVIGSREQLEFVKARLSPAPADALTRCSLCNGWLEGIDHAAARGMVPESVLFRHSEFRYCRGCGKAYWLGSHKAKMDEVLEAPPASCGNGGI